jgi:hypothetical protein
VESKSTTTSWNTSKSTTTTYTTTWSTLAVHSTGLVRYYDLYEEAISGTTWLDQSISNEDAVLHNGPVESASPKCITMDGSNDYIRMDNPGFDEDDDWTMTIWVRWDRFDRCMLLGTGHTTNSYGMDVLQDSKHPTTHGSVRVGVRGGSGGPYTVQTDSGMLTDDTWYYIAGTYEANTTIKVYIDAVLDNTTNIAGSVPSLNAGSEDMHIGYKHLLGGSSSGADELDGKIGAVTIYNRVLSLSEIEDNYELHKNDYT